MASVEMADRSNVAFSEEIKKIRANLKFSSVDKDVKVIAITSSLPGEGKSTISSNLAAAFAGYDEKVLLIDCDLRKGRQKKIFNVADNEKEGLSNLLITKDWMKSAKSFIKTTKIENLFLLPTGPYPPNPSELLANKKFKELIEYFSKYFSIIILDCPPIVGLNDALVVSTYADITLLVAKYKSTSINVLEDSKKALEKVGARLSGVILNQIDKRESSYYYNSYYDSYYRGRSKE